MSITAEPMKPKVAAVAFKVTQVRVGVVLSFMIARAKFTPPRFNPMASAVPPLMPANALTLFPPSNNSFTVTSEGTVPPDGNT